MVTQFDALNEQSVAQFSTIVNYYDRVIIYLGIFESLANLIVNYDTGIVPFAILLAS